MLPGIIIILCTTLISKCTSSTFSGQSYIDLTKQPFFVDKTKLIKTFFEEDDIKHVFITAPPGFGKTTNLQMLRSFSEIELDLNHKPKIYTSSTAHQVFQSLAISNYTEIVEKHMAQHVVIYIDLESDNTMGKKLDLKKTITFFNNKLYQSFEQYKWLLDMPKEELADQIELLEKLNQKTLSNEDNSTLVLRNFANILHLYFGKDVIILIDNYDSVFSTFLRPSQQEMETFYQYLSAVFRDTFDNNTIVSLGLIMGTSSLPMVHVLSSLSKAKHYNFLSDHSYTPYIGFTDPEAVNLLLKYNCSADSRTLVKNYYNGYKTKTKTMEIYNPSSLTQYLTNINDSDALRPYRNISTKEYNFLMGFKDEKMLGHLLRNLQNNMTAKFEHYETFTVRNFQSFFNTCEGFQYKVSEVGMLFSFFFDQGYLSHDPNQIIQPVVTSSEDHLAHQFLVPNLEVLHNVNELSDEILGYDSLKLPKKSQGKKNADKKSGQSQSKAPKIKKGAANKTTIAHNATKAAKIKSTAAQKETTSRIESTTAQSEATVVKIESMVFQNETTAAKIELTTAQSETTVVKIESMVSQNETTAAKIESTTAQSEATVVTTVARTETSAQPETTFAKNETLA